MSNSNFVITPATTPQSGIRTLNTIIPTCPFFDTAGNLNMNGLALIGNASSATDIALTSDNTNGTYFIPFSKTTSPTTNSLFIDNATTPLTYNPSLSTLTSTIFSTATAPVSANQLGNKTYIDNFGGTGGWYFTSTVSVTAGTVFSFTNCLSNAYNAYEIYFVPSISSYTGGTYPDITVTFTGGNVPVYQSWLQDQSTGGSITTSFVTTAPRLIRSLDYSVTLNRTATMKLDLWGTRNVSSGPGSFRMSYVNEGFNSQNPGITSWVRSTGTVAFSTGILTGIVLTYSNLTDVTGSITIVVKSKY